MTRKSMIVTVLAVTMFAGLSVWLTMLPDTAALLERNLKLGLFQPTAEAAGIRSTGERKPTQRSVRLVHPEAAPKTATLTLSGRTAPAEHALVQSRASGIVIDRHVDIGDSVKAGDVLVAIDAPEIDQELQRARAAINQIKARLELARLNVVRAENLVGPGHLSVQTLDERRVATVAAEADLEAQFAEVKRLEEVRGFQTVRAPFSGTIVARQVERGDRVSANSGQQGSYLLRIARLDELRIEIDVPQSYALTVKKDAVAKVWFDELPGETLEARVVRTADFIEQSSSTMRAELLMPNPGNRIPAGLQGQVALEIAQANGTVTVPTNTLITRDGRQMVATVNGENRIELKPASISRDLGERVVISSGLTVSDRVVISPNALLRAGDQVEIVTQAAPNAQASR